jgi:hypothetical protein
MGLFSFIGGLFGGGSQKKAARRAAELQFQAAQAGIAESARQFDQTREDFRPFQEVGTAAAGRFSALAGLDGDEVQASAIETLRNSPIYQSLFRNGEQAVLANASATGGIRGGNTQASLFNLGEDALARSIERDLGIFGGAMDVGMGAAGQVGFFGANAVRDQNDLRNQGAGAKAQEQLIRGGINARNWQNAGSFLDTAIASAIPGGGKFASFAKKLF